MTDVLIVASTDIRMNSVGNNTAMVGQRVKSKQIFVALEIGVCKIRECLSVCIKVLKCVLSLRGGKIL